MAKHSPGFESAKYIPSVEDEVADDPYADLSDSERIAEYQKTGDPDCLTVSAARQMRVSPEVMQHVVGATNEDIQSAEAWTKEDVTTKEERTQDSTDRQKQIEEYRKYIQNTLDVFAEYTEDCNLEARKQAFNKLFSEIFQSPHAVFWIINSIRYDSEVSFHDINAIEELFRAILRAYAANLESVMIYRDEDEMLQAERLEEVLQEFYTAAQKLIAGFNEEGVDPDSSYFFTQRIQQFAHSIIDAAHDPNGFDTQHMIIDPRETIPFEITKGVYAVVEPSNDQIFIATEEQSKTAETIVSNSWTPEYQHKNAPKTYEMEYVNEDLLLLTESIHEEGTPLTEYLLQFENVNNTELHDYLAMMHSSVREIIEHDFDVELINLNINEQFRFLNYLKHTTVDEAEIMQGFTKTHGVEGMRTFLALEQEGEHFGDEIVAFGTHKKAGEVFHSYSLLLDEAEEVESLIRNEIECEESECEDLVAKAHEKIFAQANQYLVSAIRAHEEPENIDKISEEIGHARALAAAISVALGEGKIRGVESLASFKQEVLTGEEANERELTEQLTSIYERNLKASSYSKESIEELKEKFVENLSKEHAQLYSWIVGERDVLSFVLVNEAPEQKSAFVSGLNVNPDIKTSRGGVGLINEIQSTYDAKGWTLHAVASPKNAERYTHFGFVATERENSTDLPYKLKMVHHPEWEFRSRQEGRGQLLAHLDDSKNEYRSADGRIIVWRTGQETETPPQLGEGYVITQMFSKKQGSERMYYFILERFDATELTSTHSTGLQTQSAA